MHEEISISIYYELVDKMIEEIRKILDDRKINDREQAAKK